MATERRLTREELAAQARVPVEELDRLAESGVLFPDAEGRHPPADLARLRVLEGMTRAGLTPEDRAEAIAAGLVSFRSIGILYPDPPTYTTRSHADLVAETGLSYEMIGRLVLALGFATPPPDHPVREDDERLMRLVLAFSDALEGDDDTRLRVARLFGDTLQRLAEGGLALFDERITTPMIQSGGHFDPETSEWTNTIGRRLMTISDELIPTLFRRHLETALVRYWAENAELMLELHGLRPARPAIPEAVAFVDLSGYTQTTEAAGDEVGARMAGALAEVARDCALRNGSKLVKLLGDGVMIHSPVPRAAVLASLDLIDRLPHSELPAGHAGVHAGPLIERDGDYFGRTVNLAARVSGVATGGEVLVSSSVAEHARDGLDYEPRGSVSLKGVAEPVELFRVRRLPE